MLPDPPMPDPWDDAMLDGEHARALACNDATLAGRRRAGEVADDPGLPYHRRWVWDGTPPDGRDVLVRCYHGLGDALQFARLLPALRARARSVTLEAPAALAARLAQGWAAALAGPGGRVPGGRAAAPARCRGATLEMHGAGARAAPGACRRRCRLRVPAGRAVAAAGRLAGEGRARGAVLAGGRLGRGARRCRSPGCEPLLGGGGPAPRSACSAGRRRARRARGSSTPRRGLDGRGGDGGAGARVWTWW